MICEGLNMGSSVPHLMMHVFCTIYMYIYTHIWERAKFHEKSTLFFLLHKKRGFTLILSMFLYMFELEYVWRDPRH
jgi:hypothetical protein